MSIEKAYNQWAAQYDSNANKTRDLDAKATVSSLSKYAFETALELGCGTGKNTIFLSEKAKQVIALDFSANMLQKAKEKIKRKNASFIQADLLRPWPVSDGVANLVIANLVLEHIGDLGSIFRQASQKLQKGGIFFICELHPIKQYLGSKARYEDENGTHELEVYTHHVSEYLSEAQAAGFNLIELKEWFDGLEQEEVPRLISFIFKKSN